MNHLSLYLPGLLLAALTAIAAFAWWLMVKRPRRWGAWVDRENDFWVQKGILSANSAERIKRHEKGPIPKMLAAAATCVGLAGLVTVGISLTQVIQLEHQTLRLPSRPTLIQKPVRWPAPSPTAKPAVTNHAPNIRKQP